MLRTVGRCGGLMSSAVDSGSSSPGSIPGGTKCDVYLGRHFTFEVPLSAQVYKWVPANLMLGVTL